MSKITKKELFKFCDENNDAINELQSQSDSTDFALAVLIQQLKDSGVIDEISPEPKPQLKQLDQSAFDHPYVDDRFNYVALNADGQAVFFESKPVISNCLDIWVVHTGSVMPMLKGYDNSNWKNSLIERDIAKELLEVDLSSELTGSDLCRAMLERGDKFILCSVDDCSDNDAINDLEIQVVGYISNREFVTQADGWKYAVPINNQGEPLTASEVGL